ncbi:MAG: hypothetical protein ACR2Q3_00715 [Woeseiaceae bacterium]
MHDDDTGNVDSPLGDDSLDTIDAVARTAYIWIRSISLNEIQDEDERYALAGGLVAGLCERLALNPTVRELVAYVYTLLNNEGSQALIASRLMLEEPISTSLRDAFARGRSEAAGIVEMLAFHDRRVTLPKDDTDDVSD